MLASFLRSLAGGKPAPADPAAAMDAPVAAASLAPADPAPASLMVVPRADGFSAIIDTALGMLIVDRDEPDIAARMQAHGAYGPESMQELTSWAKASTHGAVVLDVGAGTGIATLVLARAVAPVLGVVHAFEPRHRAFSILAGNMALGSIENVVCHCASVAAAAGPAAGIPAVAAGRLAPAPVVSIDSLALPRVDFIRAHAAVAAQDVLAGARQTILRDRPVIALGRPPAGIDAPGRDLIGAGYVLYEAGGHFICWPREHAQLGALMGSAAPWAPAEAPAEPVAASPATPGAGAPAVAAGSFLEYFDQKFAPLLEHRAPGFRVMFERLEAICRARPPGQPALIVETGSLRIVGNWRGDGQSTVLWKEFARFHPCEIHTVDLDPVASWAVREACGDAVHVHTGDSVAYLYQFARQQRRQIDLLYFDSFDLDLEDPFPSAFHHIKEMIAAAPCLGPGSLIGVDDNYRDAEGNITGKGYLLLQWFKHMEIAQLHDGYQYVWQL